LVFIPMDKKVEYKSIPATYRPRSSKYDMYQRHFEAKNKDIQDLIEKQRASEKDDLKKLENSSLRRDTGLTAQQTLTTLNSLARKRIDHKYNPDVKGDYEFIVRYLEEKYPLGKVWSTQDLKDLPVEPNKDSPVEPNIESAQELDKEISVKASSSQQDIPSTDVETKNQLMSDLKKLAHNKNASLAEVKFIASTLLEFYNTKFDNPKYFEKKKYYWKKQKSNAKERMDNISLLTKISEDYKKLEAIYHSLEALDTN